MNEVVQFPLPELVSNQSEMAIASLPTTVGGQLAASRLQKTWTIQFVAEQLKLSQTQIAALEADKFEELPQLVIVRGFVRAYAKLLRIDADALVALLPRESETVKLATSLRPALSTPFIDSRMSLMGHHDNNNRYIYGAVALLVLVGLFLLAQRFDLPQSMSRYFGAIPAQAPNTSEIPAISEESKSTVEGELQSKDFSGADSVNAVVTSAAPKLDPVAPNSVPVTPNPKLNAVAVGTDKVESGAQAPAPVMPATDISASSDPNSVNSTAIARLPPIGELFTVKFKQDSWIQVKTESGLILSSHLARAGTQESFSVKQALQIKIGNAAGVDASLRGAALPITPEKGSNVANLSVK